MARRLAWLGALVPALFVSQVANAAWDLNLTQGVTETSQTVFDIHMTLLWICVVIGVGVFGVMIYSIFTHRKSKGAVAAQFHESTTIEIIWTVIPTLLLVVMAIPSTVALIDLEDNSASDMSIQVVGYQWKWQYKYLDEELDFFSNLAASSRDQINSDPTGVDNYLLEVDNRLVIPAGKKVRFLITANDVIHSWWVPDFGWKQDAIPGFINEAWTRVDEPGIYRGQCTELCGIDHGFMPIVVEVKPQAEYDAWVAEQKSALKAAAASGDREWAMAELMEKGDEVYMRVCVACHQANGQGIPPAFPAIAGGAISTGPIKGHLDQAMNGVPGTAMQAFAAQLNDVELAAVVTYQRNAFGNEMGDMVQPADVKAAR
ncbi:MAG: cytochrome c oxidase subunit II [Gammaproteobacteria bacterium]|nr:MAG: cytochrome c oxidase subunit II [Gammaproteobacteria bacterium]